MWEWLMSPVDPARLHDVTNAIAWHGRAMVLGWGLIAPIAVIAARYFKIMPGQDFPQELDNQTWWRSHWIGHVCVLILSVAGLTLVLPFEWDKISTHGMLGTAVLVALIVQIALGVFRGSKGGPTAPAKDGSPRGDHYDMTPRRRWFEVLHKSLGYVLLVLAGVTVLYGMSKANAPNWMWLTIVVWWLGLGAFGLRCERKGMAVGSYQAIWGHEHAREDSTLAAPARRPSHTPEFNRKAGL